MAIPRPSIFLVHGLVVVPVLALFIAAAQPAAPRAPAASPAPANAAVPASAQTVALQARYDREVKPLFVQFCFSCHGNGKDKGDVNLDRFTTLASVQADAKGWRAIAAAVAERVMPPENKPQPTDAQRKAMAQWVSEALDHHDCSGPRDPGHVPIRRLNRTEYNNTIRDLVGIDDFRPADDFPADDTGYGFDTIADVLTVSPLLTEKYLAAAEQVMERAFATEARYAKASKAARYEGAEMRNTTGQRARGKAWQLGTEGEVWTQHDFALAGKHEVRVTASADQAGPDPARMAVKLDGRVVKVFEVKSRRDAPETFKLPLDVRPAGARRLAVAFLNNWKDAKDPTKDRNLYVHSVEVEPLEAAAAGFRSPVLRKIFVAMPGRDLSEDAAARLILRKFAARAYRRPATADEVERLVRLFRAARADGDDFPQAVRHALTAVLVSPNFLFRIEPDPPGARDSEAIAAVRTLTDHELATRLSYFLWSSMPDEELTAAADTGRLKNPAELERQVKRMLADPKAEALVVNFAGQWLELRNLAEITPDPKRFPGFDEELKKAMVREAELFFAHVMRQDRPVLELLHADYTFVNGRLAEHYGMLGVRGKEFQQVSLHGTPRGGVLTMGGVLTVTAMPARTSPVKRGKFILEQILGTPPPPPPADVPPLPDKPEDARAKTQRERLEIHRRDPTCASCHVRMDALGFTMENFDAVGAYRTLDDGGQPIDPAATLPDGTQLGGPDDLRKMLLGRKDEFVRCLAEKMLTYAIGRGPEPYDRCTVHDITRAVEQDGYRFSALVMAIVKSDAFMKRRGKAAR